ncbi:MAG: YtxH domain-containing protein [Candidatus Caenarcaniphilales bacterium]|nr:YtxH domain-containing protein [Candidatus Caenarcaniphilales bacterium]
MSNNNDGGPLWTGLLLGLITGTVVALLYTPKPGKEIRSEIKSKTDELPNDFNRLLGDIRELYSKSSEVLLNVSKEQCVKLQSALEDAEKAVQSKLDESKKEKEAVNE